MGHELTGPLGAERLWPTAREAARVCHMGCGVASHGARPRGSISRRLLDDGGGARLATLSRLAKLRAIGEEALSGSALTIMDHVWAATFRFSSLSLSQMKKDVRKSRFEAAAAALRENLKRRKVQSRGRAAHGPESDCDALAPPTGHENAIPPRDTQ